MMTAAELRAHRERLGLTQRELAQALGCSQQRVEAMERGRHGRAKHIDPNRPVPEDVAARVLAMRPRTEPTIRPTAEELRVRECIARQVCPVCGRAGWTMLARHTSAAHGISARGLREMAALPISASLCAPEYSEHIRSTRRGHLTAISAGGAAAAAEQLRGARIPHGRGGKVARSEANRRRTKETD